MTPRPTPRRAAAASRGASRSPAAASRAEPSRRAAPRAATGPVSDTRQALIEAAERLFSERGYGAVGIREIVEAAGANVASIKYHFGSKRDLYLAAVRWVVEQRPTAGAWESLAVPPRGRLAAASLLAGFLRELLHEMLVADGSRSCQRLMLQEAMRPSEALHDVVRCHVQPHEQRLCTLLSAIAPDADAPLLERTARAVLGQVLYYSVFRSFLEAQDGRALFAPASLAAIADHVTTGALHALGCSPRFVARALAGASPTTSGTRRSKRS